MGYVGDFMVKVLQFPLRFSSIPATPGNYRLVLPYRNVLATSGIRSEFNPDYNAAQYQISYINNPRALRVLPFRPEAVNPNMPFLVRDYGGRWKFATNDLGADCSGKPIDNSRGNKGKFIADFQLAVKPEHPEWLEAIFHRLCVPQALIIAGCTADPGDLTQNYNSADPVCPRVIQFLASTTVGGTNFVLNANTSIMCSDNYITSVAINAANVAALVVALQLAWDTEFGAGKGTWSVVSGNLIQISGTTCDSVTLEFSI
jgi:Ni,Fe-hydrogenase III small subunit